MKALFVSFEGTDGCGKSTQIELFEKYLADNKIEYIRTREPGGTRISERIREIIMDSELKEMNPITEALLFAAARAQHASQTIKPAIREGKVVICDRYVDSSIVYQGIARNLGDQVKMVNDFAIQGIKPDITFFLSLSAEESKKRNSATGKADRLEQESLDFHKKVYDGYLKLAADEPDRIIVIDASQSIEQIAKTIQNKFEEYARNK